MGIELRQPDEFLHRGGESREPEWFDLNFYDPSIRLGAFLRLQHHQGRGYTNMDVCLYLPDGRTAFMSERSGANGDLLLAAGGLRVDVVRPFEELDIAYDGKLLLVEDPYALYHPERAWAENPQTDGTVRLTFSSLSTLYEDGGDPRVEAVDAVAGHYEQLGSVIGSVRIGDDELDVDGFGLRGHRWGIDPSEPPSWRRRLTANVGPSFGFMGFDIGLTSGAHRSGGFVWDGTALHVCDGLAITTVWAGAETVHHGLDLTLRDGDQAWHARGTVMSLVVRRDDEGDDNEEGAAGRLSEGMTEWRMDDGQIGYGMSEYFDRMLDGRPSGLSR
jgi:hypothetical protein